MLHLKLLPWDIFPLTYAYLTNFTITKGKPPNLANKNKTTDCFSDILVTFWDAIAFQQAYMAYKSRLNIKLKFIE